jgi:hypothetical protein
MSVESKSPDELQEHMLWSYYGLRVGLAAIGIALPLVVLFAGQVLHHVWLEPSLSDYYHTENRVGFFTTRDLFVGGLFAAAACLYLYKGFSNKENLALNLAGIFAVFVAVLPSAGKSGVGVVSTLHNTSAVLFFLSIAYVSLFRSRDTLELLKPAQRARYARWYFWTGVAMIVSPAAAVVLSFALEATSGSRTVIFWVETFGVWTFAAYWIVKTLEMRKSEAEKLGLDAELKREIVSGASPAVAAAPSLAGVVTSVNPPAISSGSGSVERIARR